MIYYGFIIGLGLFYSMQHHNVSYMKDLPYEFSVAADYNTTDSIFVVEVKYSRMPK